MNCFRLLHSLEELTLDGNEKVLKAEQFSQLIEMRDLLEKVKEDANLFKKALVEEQELAVQAAREEGFREGLDALAQSLEALDKQKAEMLVRAENEIVPLVVQLAEKVVGQELEQNPKSITSIVAQGLKAVTTHKFITIYVNRKHLEQLETDKSILKKKLELVETLAIEARDDIEEGGCEISTEAGIINARLPHVMESLERAFRSLWSQKDA